MKNHNKSAFTLIELLITLALIGIIGITLAFGALAMRGCMKMNENNQSRLEQAHPDNNIIYVGDTVYIPSLSITGVVNMRPAFGIPFIDIMVKNTNGSPHIIKGINIALLKKITPIEK